MKRRGALVRLLRRAEAVFLCAFTLWTLGAAAGSETAAQAWRAVARRVPEAVLRAHTRGVSGAEELPRGAALALTQSPLLRALRQSAAKKQPAATEKEPAEPVSAPAQSAEREEEPDNGVRAKTLTVTDASDCISCGGVFIRNTSGHAITEADACAPFSVSLSDTSPQILILHTHGSEAYTPADGEAPDDHRSAEADVGVVGVGDAMAEAFSAAGISVLHDRTRYDDPLYAGAYDRSLAAVERYVAEYPSISVVLDVHRDALEDSDGAQLKLLAPVGEGRSAAQLSLVVGSDGGGAAHPNWIENLRLAVAVGARIERDYPTLLRPILLRASRYNQHVSPGALLVEVGTAGNSPEEAARGARIFAEELTAVLLEKQRE